jgi:serine/threonine protein kinase
LGEYPFSSDPIVRSRLIWCMLPLSVGSHRTYSLPGNGGIFMSENTPKRIGDYEVIRELGHGGMGEVYLVRNVLCDRVEAMKVLLPSLAGRSDFVARFMREIKVLASLDHPNIAALRTAFTADDQFVMIMEYVEGITLAQRLEKGAFSSSDALNYVDQVLAALSYAHGKHVIHRDIKPGNMMLTPQGIVKLMDFGLARSADEVGLTITGTTLGSLDYASPEQVQSQPTDERSDLYSAGVSLYQMVTGQRMFSVTSSFSLMEAQIKQTPRPPIEIVPTVPKALNDVIMMAVSKDPAQRFQSADAFRNALSQIAESSVQPSNQTTAATGAFVGRDSTPAVKPAFDPGFTVPTNPASQTNRNLLLVLAAVLLAALLAGAAIYKSRQRGPQDVAAATSVQTPSAPGSASGASDHGNTQTQDAPPPQVTPAPTTDSQAEDKTSTPKQPAVVARKTRAEGGNTNSAPGVSAEDIQAQQQAALEQKKLFDAMETEVDQLDNRAASAESSIDTLEQQLHRDGLGLRGDVVASRNNMRTDLAKARQAMEASDIERARRYMDMAHRELEHLEAFLGRR